MSQKVALILSGCGVYDGTEVHEASACLVHLSACGAEVAMFAPDIDQMHVINHLDGSEQVEKRSVLQESARIARGKVRPLSELETGVFDALLIPGGFGAAKNLCDFAVKGAECSVRADVASALTGFHAQGKPIGLCCIAPVLAAKVLHAEVTMGAESEENGRWPHSGATGAVAKLGGRHVTRDVTECHVDQANRVVTTPAFMCETQLHLIHQGIGTMVKELLSMVKPAQ